MKKGVQAGGRSRRDWMKALSYKTIAEERAVSLSRNLADRPFRERCSEDEKKEILARIKAAVRRTPLPRGAHLTLDGADHLMVSMGGDAAFDRQFKALHKWAKEVERTEPFATLPFYGYLSPDPNHVGTGISCAYVASLWGLYLTNTLDAAIRALVRLGFDVHPQIEVPEDDDNAPDAPGCRYVISSVRDTGRAEEIVSRMDAVCAELSRQEANARMRLQRDDAHDFSISDFLARSFAIGERAMLVSRAEALDLLSVFLFAEDMGYVLVTKDIVDNVRHLVVFEMDRLGEEDSFDTRCGRASLIINKLFANLKRK